MARKPPLKPDKRWRRPENRRETLFQIDATYALNNWGEPERAANVRRLGLEPKPLADCSDKELKIIHDDLSLYRQILFEEEKTTSEN